MKAVQKPIIKLQVIINNSVSNIFEVMIHQNRLSEIWLASSDGPLIENQTTLWMWPELKESVAVTPNRIVPYTYVSLFWHDTLTTVDMIFTKLTSDATILELQAYDFKENGDQLIRALQNKQDQFTIAIRTLESILKNQSAESNSLGTKN